MIIPAITLYQPWASLIAVGVKQFETRSFRCPERLLGQRVAIHAAKRLITSADFDQDVSRAITSQLGLGWRKRLPLGAVVCTAMIIGSEPADTVHADLFGDYSPGRWAWRLGLVEKIDPPRPARGWQMIGWPWLLEPTESDQEC